MKHNRQMLQAGSIARFVLLVIFMMLPIACGHSSSTAALPDHNAAPDDPTDSTTAALADTVHSLSMSTQWTHLSSTTGDLPVPHVSAQQTASLVLDIDRDGVNDFVIGSRQEGKPSLVWYRRTTTGWEQYLIEDTTLDIEAGGAFYDITGNGALDIVMGGDYQSNEIWWWENPYPNYDPDVPWQRYVIKNSGENMHHDMIFGDFTGDGQTELLFWNQRVARIFMAPIPADPRATQPWPYTEIYAGGGEGMAKADIDGDGNLNLIAGGRWFKHTEGTNFTAYSIDDSQYEARIAVGDLTGNGRPEVVMVPGDGIGRLKWYECTGDPTDPGCWVGHDLLGFDVDHGHSLAVADINDDGHLDIFCAEMRLNGGNPDAKMWIFLGDGQGNFTTTEVATGFGNHESRVADLTGNGRLDILGKPYNWETPRIDIWLNTGDPGANTDPGSNMATLPLDRWERHVIDADKPWTSIFITAADIDGDDRKDIITGGWWYKNPGTSAGQWMRNPIGTPLNNMAAVFDFDGSGRLDILGTEGKGADTNARFVWAHNAGGGQFTILDNIQPGDGDFLQGVAVERFQAGGPLEVALSWHAAGKGIQMLRVPANPLEQAWEWRQISPVSQDEALSVGDIDRNGQPDLLLGTQWLRNAGGTWQAYTLHATDEPPDRNILADINGNDRLDAVVGYEAISAPGKLAWYEQGADPTAPWTEHVIDTLIGPMSLDVADMNGNGFLDVVVGEHNIADPSSARLLIYENVDGTGTEWRQHLVFMGDEHHDGAIVVDIDGDGDYDIISIGWSHNRVLLYENKAIDGDRPGSPPGSSTPLPTAGMPVLTPTTSAEGLLPTAEVLLPTPTAVAAVPVPTADANQLPLVLSGLQALYTFEEGSGTVVRDVSGVGPTLDLTVRDVNAIRWVAGGLVINAPTLIASDTAATKVIDAVRASNEITVEAWVEPATTTQDGPARIVTISHNTLNRNVTLSQGLWGDQPPDLYDARLRTTATDANGEPSLSTPAGTLTTALTHVVYTRATNQEATLYVNGAEQISWITGGDMSNWDTTYRLAIGNELTGERPWLGTIYRVAIYNRALTPAEITRNFNAGAAGSEEG